MSCSRSESRMDASANPLNDGLRILARIIARDIARRQMKDQPVERQAREDPESDTTNPRTVLTAA